MKDKNIKRERERERKRTSGQELVPQGREGVVKQEKFPCTGEFPHSWDQEGAAEPQRAMQKWEPRGKYRESCTSQPLCSSQVSPDQRVEAGSQEKWLTSPSPAQKEGARSQEKHDVSLPLAGSTCNTG